MATDVLESAKHAVVAANDEYGVRAATVFEVVTGFGDMIDCAGDLPYLRPHPLDLELRERRGVVALRRHQSGAFGGVPIASSRRIWAGLPTVKPAGAAYVTIRPS